MQDLNSNVILGSDGKWYVVYEGMKMAYKYKTENDAWLALQQMKELDSKITLKEGQRLLD